MGYLSSGLRMLCGIVGVDTGEWSTVYNAARQLASAAICGETGENRALCDKGEVVDTA